MLSKFLNYGDRFPLEKIYKLDGGAKKAAYESPGVSPASSALFLDTWQTWSTILDNIVTANIHLLSFKEVIFTFVCWISRRPLLA